MTRLYRVSFCSSQTTPIALIVGYGTICRKAGSHEIHPRLGDAVYRKLAITPCRIWRVFCLDERNEPQKCRDQTAGNLKEVSRRGYDTITTEFFLWMTHMLPVQKVSVRPIFSRIEVLIRQTMGRGRRSKPMSVTRFGTLAQRNHRFSLMQRAPGRE